MRGGGARAGRKGSATPLEDLEERIRARLAAVEAEAGLYDFIPRIAPWYKAPAHLGPLVEELDKAVRGQCVRVVCHAPPRHGKPLGKDTRVTMADGSLRCISKLCVGDRVVSGAGRPTTVTAVYPQGQLTVFRVTTRAGRSFLAEGSHRFLTQRGWLRIDALRACNRKAWQRPRGDYLLAGAQYVTEPIDVGVDVARFLGYMIGDGNATQRNCRWTNIDPIVRAEFSRIVRSLGGDVVEHDSQTLGVVSGNGRLKRTPEQQRAWNAAYEAKRRRDPAHREPRKMGRHHLKVMLETHGIDGKKAHDKIVPEAVFTAPRAEVAAFLAAFFECDGSRGAEAGERGANASFSSVSRRLLDGCQSLLARLGIRSSLYVKRGRYKGSEHLSWQLSILDQARFFDLIPVIGSKAGRKNSDRRTEQDRHLRDAVISVEPAGVEYCYCITVEEDESFLAEGLVTHNTETVLHSIGLGLRRNPRMVFGYATYGADLSYSKSRSARDIARRAGVELAGDATAVKEWRTRDGGGLLATGVGGPLTGFGVNCLFVDDPFKNRVEAESAARRRQVIDWWNDVAFTRLEPGASAIVFATRWHPEDLSGHLIAKGWKYIRLPALDDAGRALWPDRYDAQALLEIKRQVGEYTWASLYQGVPRPRGGSVFQDTYGTYSAAALTEILKNPAGYRKGIGIDLAYSKRTSADYSAAVVGLSVMVEKRRLFYILDVLRRQEEARVFAGHGKALQEKHGGAQALWYASGPEQGVADLMKGYGFRVTTKPAVADKFTRAQPYAASWNDQRVLLPADVAADSWVNVFLGEHLSFTGMDGEEDDQVDAGAAMHDLLNAVMAAPRGVGTQSLGLF